ncbi:MAG: outer membrane protein assembly factor BamD [Candidatus Dadabacteria bacterium]|nr:MAG: outer membrane protein assembly factor BamD [Candidatus Dadabacteria bacterium]
MRRNTLEISLLAIFGITILLLQGCSLFNKGDEKDVVELSEDPSGDKPAQILLATAQKYYISGIYKNAREYFERLRDGYPFGTYAEYAEIKIADCYFYEGEYGTAASLYGDFVTQHPASYDIPYALIQQGRSYEMEYGGTGKDKEPLKKAIKAYTKLIESYPHSPYYMQAKELLEAARKKLIENENFIVAFYKKTKKETAYKARLKRLKEISSQPLIGSHSTSHVRRRISGFSVPKLVLNREQVSPYLNERKTLKEQPTSTGLTHLSNPLKKEGEISALGGQCYSRSLAAIEISKLPDLTAGHSFKIDSSPYRFPFEIRTDSELSIDCLNGGAIKLSTNGELRFSDIRSLLAVLTDHPPRILLYLPDSDQK